MGTWGYGHFDNDTAADILAKQRDVWVAEIENALRHYEDDLLTPLDLEDEVMTYLEMMLRVGHDKAPESELEEILGPSILPERKRLETWRNRLVSKHLDYFGEAARTSEKFKAISGTVERLISLAE